MSIQSQSVQDVVRKATDLLLEKNISEPKLSAELLFCHALSCKRIDLYLNFDKPVRENELEIFRGYIRRRLKHEPVQYIIGETEFFGLKFSVNASVLIPRSETEILVEHVINHVKKNQKIVHILDIGTGSGIIPISILHHCRDFIIDAIDISSEAITVASLNAKKYQLQDEIHFLQMDLFSENIFSLNQQFDIIISNPPYIPQSDVDQLQPEVRDYEPIISFTDGENGLRFYKRIAEIHPRLLNDEGMIAVEIGFGQEEDVKNIFRNSGLHNFTIHKDYAGIERVVMINKRI